MTRKHRMSGDLTSVNNHIDNDEPLNYSLQTNQLRPTPAQTNQLRPTPVQVKQLAFNSYSSNKLTFQLNSLSSMEHYHYQSSEMYQLTAV